MKKGVIQFGFFIAFACILIIGCRQLWQPEVVLDNPHVLPSAEAVSITGSLQVTKDTSLLLEATVLPASARQAIIWSSKDTAIATVAPDGTVTGVAVGSTSIVATASDGSNVYAEHRISVIDDHTTLAVAEDLALYATDVTIAAEDIQLAQSEESVTKAILNLSQAKAWQPSDGTELVDRITLEDPTELVPIHHAVKQEDIGDFPVSLQAHTATRSVTHKITVSLEDKHIKENPTGHIALRTKGFAIPLIDAQTTLTPQEAIQKAETTAWYTDTDIPITSISVVNFTNITGATEGGLYSFMVTATDTETGYSVFKEVPVTVTDTHTYAGAGYAISAQDFVIRDVSELTDAIIIERSRVSTWKITNRHPVGPSITIISTTPPNCVVALSLDEEPTTMIHVTAKVMSDISSASNSEVRVTTPAQTIGGQHLLEITLKDAYGNPIDTLGTPATVHFAATPNVAIGTAPMGSSYSHTIPSGSAGTVSIPATSAVAGNYSTAVSLDGIAVDGTPALYSFTPVTTEASVSLMPGVTVIPTGSGTTELSVYDIAGNRLSGFTWTIATSQPTTPVASDTTIAHTSGLVTAGNQYGTIRMKATKGDVTAHHEIVVIDTIITGSPWVEAGERTELTAHIRPAVTGLPLSYHWDMATSDQANYAQISGSSSGATVEIEAREGVAALKLNVPVHLRVTAGAAGANTTTTTMSKTHEIDVVDLVWIHPNTLPNKLAVGAAATTVEVALQPAGADVPTATVTWQQNPAEPQEKLVITPHGADGTSAGVEGIAEYDGTIDIVATYGAGTEDISASHTITAVEGVGFVLVYAIPSGGKSDFTLPFPTEGAGMYDLVIDWGDGTPETTVTQGGAQGSPTAVVHNYTSGGTKTVTLRGNLRFGDIDGDGNDDGSFGDPGAGGGLSNDVAIYNSSNYLTGIQHWGDSQFIHNEHTLSHLKNNITLPAESPYLRGSVKGMFARSKAFNQNLNHWDVSYVTDFRKMFQDSSSFNNGQTWNGAGSPLLWSIGTSLEEDAEINMASMFHGANRFNQTLDWDTSKVTIMNHMFTSGHRFNNGNKPLAWDTSRVTRMNSLFYYTVDFNQPLVNWDTSSVTHMGHMFAQTSKFNQNIDGWDFSSIEDMSKMFWGAKRFSQNMSGWTTWDLTGKPIDGMFLSTSYMNSAWKHPAGCTSACGVSH